LNGNREVSRVTACACTVRIGKTRSRKQLIEPELDPIFLADSYGYRPRKSALDAVGVTRQRCWKYDWVLEFDIKGLFDTSTTNFCCGLSGSM
jgi:hypothetical protein